MNPRKHPRTMQEAFGPYCSREIATDDGFTWTPVRVALTITYLAALVVLYCVL
jgi:hypothetical protein